MDSDFESGYQPLQGFSEAEDEVEDSPPGDHSIRVIPDRNKARWNHIRNLDEFFTRIYQYHQRSGFTCMVLQDVLQLVQFAFVVIFTTFLINCVDYDTLFYERWVNVTHRVTLPDGIYSTKKCLSRFNAPVIICLIVAGIFWVFRLVKVLYNIFQYIEMRAFYTTALNISASELANMTWHEVQKRLLEVQKDQQMCIHKTELTQLDIYHRILRFKNYMIAMVNKDVLPVKMRMPFLGNVTFLTTGLRYNLDLLLFWGPWAPFENYWHLNSDYKVYQNRQRLAEDLSQKMLWVGVANFVLLPLIILWQILYSFFRYAEIIRREPGALGARRWSMYSRLYLRHFNELDHEFIARLNRGYRCAEKYMASFISPALTIIAKHIAFFAGSILAVLIILTLIDEDFLSVAHVLTMMGVLGATVAVCRALIPDEHMVWCPELLMRAILAQIHYMPDSWKGQAHTYRVRDQFAQLFQYKVVFLLEELLSPVVTPFVLCFSLRHRALDIVDFYRNHTIEITGTGDVCAFAQMDIRKHGNPKWVPEEKTEADTKDQAEGGKVELSLIHFTLTNPEWKAPEESQAFMNGLKNQVQRDANTITLQPLDNPLANSLHSLNSMAYGFNSMMSSVAQQSNYPNMGQSTRGPTTSVERLPVRGGLKNSEGPLAGSAGSTLTVGGSGSGGGLLTSLHQATMTSPQGSGPTHSMMMSSQAPPISGFQRNPLLSPAFPLPSLEPLVRPNIHGSFDEEALEYLSHEMSFSALYLHELHNRRIMNPLNSYFDDRDSHERELWSTEGASDIPPGSHERKLEDVTLNMDHQRSRSQQQPPRSQQMGYQNQALDQNLIEMHQIEDGSSVQGASGGGNFPQGSGGNFHAQTDTTLPQVPGPYGRMSSISESNENNSSSTSSDTPDVLHPPKSNESSMKEV